MTHHATPLSRLTIGPAMEPSIGPTIGLAPGQRAGHYEVGGLLGHGGMGTVYSARDTESDRRVAVKLLRGATAQTLYRLKHEFRVLAALQHRNIVVPYELFFHEGMLCYSMELIDGVPLVEYCARNRENPSRVRETLLQLIDALQTIHEHGIVHRDLKPGNVLVATDGRLVVLDFGIAGTLSDELRPGITAERAWVGTPSFMAPEQFSGAPASAATDWYAFGALLYECLTGAPAFPQTQFSTLLAAKQQPRVPALQSYGVEIQALVSGLLSPVADERPGPLEVRRALQTTADASHVTPRRTTTLVGRRAELQALEGALQAMRHSGRVHVSSVHGAAGIGKSLVLDSFGNQTRAARTAFVAAARCSALETLPMRLIDSLLDDLIVQVAGDGRVPLERCYPRHAAQMCALFPCTAVLFGEPAAVLEPAPAPNRELALRAVCDLLARISEYVPLVLVFDALHSAEPDSFEAILRIVLELSACPVLFVFGSTSAGAGPTAATAELLTACRQYLGPGRVTEQRLSPMPQEQLVAVAWDALPAWTGSAAVVEAVCAAAGGNPGICVWYARVLASAATPPTDVAQARGPALVRRVWEGLSAPGRELLGLLSVADGSLPRRVADALLGGGETTDAAVLDLAHHGLVRRDRHVIALAHEEIGALVAAQLGSLGARHGRLARAFVSTGGDQGRAAAHFERDGDTERARGCYEHAAIVAQTRQAHRRAVELLRCALRLQGSDPDHRRAMQALLVESLGHVGRLRESAELCARLARGRDDAASIALRHRAIGYFGALAQTERVVGLIDAELPSRSGVARTGKPLLARLVLLRARMAAAPPWKQQTWRAPPANAGRRLDAMWTAASRLLHIDPIFAAYLHARHLVLSFAAGDRRHQARALGFEAVMMTSHGGEDRLTLASTLLAAAERRAFASGDARVRASVHQGAGFMWANVGRFREAIVEGRRCIDALESAPDAERFELSHAHVELGWRLLSVGSLREILAAVPARLRQAVQCEDPVLATGFYIQAATAHLGAGRPDEAQRHLDEARRWCPATYEVGHYGVLAAQLALVLYRGEPLRALRLIQDEGPRVEALRVMKLPAVGAMYRYREGAVLLHALASGRAPDAARLRKRVDRLRAALGAQTFGVAVAHARLLDAGHFARVGDEDSAMGRLREAADRFSALGWDNIAGMARLRYLQASGAPSDPRLAEALSALGVAQCEPWARATLPPLGPDVA